MSRRRRPLTSSQTGLLVCVIAMLAPLAALGTAAALGSSLGCAVNEGGTPCLVLGLDLGPLLADLFSLFWLVILIPVWMIGAAFFSVKIALERR
jgi:hypothetical protein